MTGALLLAAAAVTASPGSTGAGISGWPVCLSTPAQPGGSYQLANGGRYGLGGPAGTTGVQVVNTGSAPETLALSVVPLHSPSLLPGALPVPASWVSFGQDQVRLDAGKYAWVTVTLHVPAGARRGAYAADIADAAVNPASPGTASLGAASTTLLLFTVGQGRPPASWPEAVTSRQHPQEHVRPDPVLCAVPDGADVQVGVEGAEGPLDLGQGLAGGDDLAAVQVTGGERWCAARKCRPGAASAAMESWFRV